MIEIIYGRSLAGGDNELQFIQVTLDYVSVFSVSRQHFSIRRIGSRDPSLFASSASRSGQDHLQSNRTYRVAVVLVSIAILNSFDNWSKKLDHFTITFHCSLKLLRFSFLEQSSEYLMNCDPGHHRGLSSLVQQRIQRRFWLEFYFECSYYKNLKLMEMNLLLKCFLQLYFQASKRMRQ